MMMMMMMMQMVVVVMVVMMMMMMMMMMVMTVMTREVVAMATMLCEASSWHTRYSPAQSPLHPAPKLLCERCLADR
jgi:biopolymer transport protein ExbB/TolQ